MSKPSYMQNLKGTIRKVKGADPLPDLSIEDQKNKRFKQGAFVALRTGYSRRVHAERIVKAVNEELKRRETTISIVSPDGGVTQVAVVSDIKAVDAPALSKILKDAGQVP